MSFEDISIKTIVYEFTSVSPFVSPKTNIPQKLFTMSEVLISVITPAYNVMRYIDETFQSVLDQTFLKNDGYSSGQVEISVYDDRSTDSTVEVILQWIERFNAAGISLVFSSFYHPTPIYFESTKPFTEYQQTIIALKELHCLCLERNNAQQNTQDRQADNQQTLIMGNECQTETLEICENKENLDHNEDKTIDNSINSSSIEENPRKKMKISHNESHISPQPSSKISQDLSGLNYLEMLRSKYIDVPYISFTEPSLKNKCVGHSRNRAVRQSRGRWLCMLDSDDMMLPRRLELQLQTALVAKDNHKTENILIGGHFIRQPAEATPRYNVFLNSMRDGKDVLKYRFRDLSVIQPTWFLHRQVYLSTRSGYFEGGVGCPEDMLFFYEALEQGTAVEMVCEPVTIYRSVFHSFVTFVSLFPLLHSLTLWLTTLIKSF